MRNTCWQSVLAGGAGVTYGHHSIWQMWEKGRPEISFVRTNWKEALMAPGARQMGYMKSFFEALDWKGFSYHPEWVIEKADSLSYLIPMVSYNETSKQAILYLPEGKPFVTEQMKPYFDQVSMTLFNPRDGVYLKTEELNLSDTDNHFIA